MCGLSAFVANAGLLIHDGVGKYVLPSNHSVLVLSDRCQSPKCGASEDVPDGIASCLSRGLGLEMLARTDVF